MGQFEVVHALALRETRTRFGAHKLGYLWAIVEPALMVLTFYVLFAIGKRGAPAGMTMYSFLATGIVPYMMFANTCSRVAESINGNQSLLFYPQVSVIDLMIARVFLEFVTYCGVFIVLMLGHSLVVQELVVDDLLLVVSGFVLATLLGAALGLVFCTTAQLSNAMHRARGPLMRPFFWVSGIFFVAGSLPGPVRKMMLYNPVLHATELSRAGWFESYDSNYVNASYVLMWIIGLLFVGLTLERVVRRRIELT
jgi:capsular polysaccharide transport system permease protein